MSTFLQDCRYGLRMLGKNPGFTAVAVLTLALGIGANTAIFSVVDAVLLGPLPYAQPDQLVAVWESNPHFRHVWVSYPNFLDWRRDARSFQRIAAFAWRDFDLSNPGSPEHVQGKAVSGGFFDFLGVKLAVGRDFTLKEDVPGGTPVAIISHRLWRSRFDASPNVLDESITLDGKNYSIVGVLASGFHFEGAADVFTPLAQGDPGILNNREIHPGILAIARLRPGVGILQAQAEMATIQNRLGQIYPDANRDLGTDVEPLKQQIVGNSGAVILMLFGAVGIVLLIACANVASLLISRSVSRTREFAIRSALGASHTRVMRQLITESVLLAMAGGGLGLAVTAWGTRAVVAAMPEGLPRSNEISVNLSVLLFTLGVSVAVGILFGLAPGLKGSDLNLEASLKGRGRDSTRDHHRAQSSLVIAQVALTLVLLVGAGLLLRTIRQMWAVHPGFDLNQVVTFKVGLAPSLMRTAPGTRTAYQQLIDRIRGIPGVQEADFTNVVPLSRQDNLSPFWIASNQPESIQGAPRVNLYWTGSNYLRAMKIPLVRGRFLRPEDTSESAPVIVIDTVLARANFPGSDPVGQTITIANWGTARIVGVAGHVRQWGLGDTGQYPQNQAYASFYQLPGQDVPEFSRYLTVVVRSPLSLPSLMPPIKKAVSGAGIGQPIYDVQTMREIASQSMTTQRSPMNLLGAFACLALLLSSIGIYGVISYSVARRTHEIGIRMALGAERRDVLKLVVGQGFKLTLLGVGIGIIGALALTRFLSNLLFGVTPTDPLTFVVFSLLLTGMALLASYIPARRATKVDPMVALRYE
jgi:putative ABC transport system permease protein